MRVLAERAWFGLCLTLGQLLRAGRYSRVRIVPGDPERQVRKHRSFYAPALVRLGDPLVRILDTGVRVLPQRDWEERERRIYQSVHGLTIQIDDRTLVLPRLPGATLAAVLEDPSRESAVRTRAIRLAASALADFHRRGFTHGDAMADNVMVDLDDGVARWFDFETLHDSNRSLAWRRADDVRALLFTCLLRSPRHEYGRTLGLVLDSYADEEVTDVLAACVARARRGPLIFHLGQAGLRYDEYREISRLLRQRLPGGATG